MPAVCGRVCPQETQCERQLCPRHQGRAGGHRPAGALCRGLRAQEARREESKARPTVTRLRSSAQARRV
ncbi:hypothetical protein [Agathobaculum sp.]|uniref:hypothetical protein n=1 Tax=Agathobaculum sp. TaxID=2048138 RepID=UPI003521ED6B